MAYGWTAFPASHFASLGRVVPGLLIDANRAAARHEGDAKLASFRLLSPSLQLVEAVAAKFGDYLQYKLPEEPDVLPPPDAILVAPATFNTLNKWAAGISDILALGLLTEAIGLQLPIVALPYLNQAQAAHPALNQSVTFLRKCGVTVLLGDGGFVPHVPRRGNVAAYPWNTALAALPV